MKYFIVKYRDWKGNHVTQIFDNEDDMLDFMNEAKKLKQLYSPPARNEFEKLMGHN